MRGLWGRRGGNAMALGDETHKLRGHTMAQTMASETGVTKMVAPSRAVLAVWRWETLGPCATYNQLEIDVRSR